MRDQDNASQVQLKAAIELELALAELKIKVRQADHAKWLPWFAALLAFAGVLIAIPFKK